MATVTLRMTFDASQLTDALQSFREIVDRLFDSPDGMVKIVSEVDRDAASGASATVLRFEPSDLLRRLVAAGRAGEGQVEIVGVSGHDESPSLNA